MLLSSATVSGLATRSLVAASGGQSGPGWQLDGLAGETVHALAADRGQPTALFAATETGVYRRAGGGSWRRVLATPSVWSVAVSGDAGTVLAGTQSGKVYISHDAGASWRSSMVTPLGVYAVTAQPEAPEHIVAGGGNGIYRSSDEGRTWRRTLTLHSSAGSAFVWQQHGDRVLFAGVVASSQSGSTGVYVSHDAGATWRIYGRALHSSGGIMALAVSADRMVFAGTMGNALWRAGVSRAVWQKWAAGMPPTGDHVAAIVVLHSRPATLFAATLGHGIFRSADAGARWTSVSDGLPDGERAVVLSLVVAGGQHELVAGTTSGVFRLVSH